MPKEGGGLANSAIPLTEPARRHEKARFVFGTRSATHIAEFGFKNQAGYSEEKPVRPRQVTHANHRACAAVRNKANRAEQRTGIGKNAEVRVEGTTENGGQKTLHLHPGR